jgi:3-oxoacyl-[acyl-carrier protein] reductase
MTLSGQVAVVTGAAQGLGRAFALALAAEGADIIALDVRSPEETADLVEARGRRARALTLDVSDGAAVGPALAAAVQGLGRVDILINNAATTGQTSLIPFDAIEEADWDRVMAVNLKGMWLCARALVPPMKAQGRGRIVNMTSGTVFTGQPLLLHYVSSKGAIIGFTNALARELTGSGVNVNAIAPGYTVTEGSRTLAASGPQAFEADMLSRQIIPRLAQPADLVGAMLFLVSDGSDFITGQTLNVDGGLFHH